MHLREVLSHFSPLEIPDNLSRSRRVASGEVSEIHQPNVRLTDRQRERLVAAYARGAFLKDLATEFGIDVQTVKRQLKQAGVELRPWPALTDERINQLVRDYTETEIPIAKLAEHYGVGYGTVRRALHAAGINVRPRGRRSRR